MSDTLRLSVPLPAVGKARPRVTRRGTYMPPEYVAWKASFVAWCRANVRVRIVGRFAISALFYTPTGKTRCDVDNALGAVLDALQDAGVTENDSRADEIHAKRVKAKGPRRIDITLTALE